MGFDVLIRKFDITCGYGSSITPLAVLQLEGECQTIWRNDGHVLREIRYYIQSVIDL